MDHLKTLSILNFVMGGMSFLAVILIAGGIGAILVLSGGALGAQELVTIGMVGTVALVMALTIGVLEIMAGLRIRQGRGRILQTVVALLNISSFPIGMAFALYGLWVCWMNEETKAKFEAVARGEVLD